MKKRIIAIILTAATTLSLIGCGANNNTKTANETSGGSGKKTVTVWAWDPKFNIAIMNEAKEVYEKENPNVEINVVDFAKTDVEQKLHTILASGTTKDLPEIVLIEDYNSQKYIQSYPGAFEDLTGKMPFDQFAQYKTKILTVDGKTYGVPFDSGVTGYYYRTDILTQAGFKEEDLKNITWERFIEIGKVVKEKTGKPMLAIDPSDLGLLRTILNGAGTWYFDKEGNPYFTQNEALKEGLQVMKTMVDTGVASMYSGWADFLKGFNSGAVAGVATGVWITPSVMQEESQKGLWRIAPTPRLQVKGAVNASNLGGSSWYVLSGSENKDAAIEFMKSVYTNKDFYQTILAKNGAVASYLPSMDGEAYKKQSDYFGGQAIYADMSKWMKEVPSVSYGMYTYEAEAILASGFSEVLNGKSIDEVLKSVEEQVKMQIK